MINPNQINVGLMLLMNNIILSQLIINRDEVLSVCYTLTIKSCSK